MNRSVNGPFLVILVILGLLLFGYGQSLLQTTSSSQQANILSADKIEYPYLLMEDGSIQVR